MDNKKLQKWADLLLDTGKRNNLINFRDTKYSTVEIIAPSADILLDRIEKRDADGKKPIDTFAIFVPESTKTLSKKPVFENQLTLNLQDTQETPDAIASFENRYSEGMDKKHILLHSDKSNPLVIMRNIIKRASDFIEETGVNVAYMAFGFIHWTESESSQYIHLAPVLLAPIQFIQPKKEEANTIDHYGIKPDEDDIIVNPTFAYKLEAETGRHLPEYDGDGLSVYLDKIRNIVQDLSWEVSDECKIGLFSFQKINMYRDLIDNASAILDNQNVQLLLGEKLNDNDSVEQTSLIPPVTNPLIELHSVVDADSSQIEAIEMAKSGKSFVLQGPPGTGKSQTITNIIAECLSDGKKVLFVSEKLAALNVVYDKLTKAGLAEFCLELHSNKASRKQVITELCNTLYADKTNLSARAQTEIVQKEKAQKQLDAYATALHEQQPCIEKSLYKLYESYAAFRSFPEVDWPIPQITTKNELYMTDAAQLLEQYADYMPVIGYDYTKYPWYGYIKQDMSYQTKSELKKHLSSLLQFLTPLTALIQDILGTYGIQCDTIEDVRKWQTTFEFLATSKVIKPALLNKGHFDQVYPALQEMRTQSKDNILSRSALDAAYNSDIYKIDGEEYYKKLTTQFNGAFAFISRLFSSEYKQLVNELSSYKKDGSIPAYKEAVSITKHLVNYRKTSEVYAKAESPVKQFLGSDYHGIETDWDNFIGQIDKLQNILSMGISIAPLAQLSDFDSERRTFAKYADELASLLAKFDAEDLLYLAECFDVTVFDVNTAKCSTLLTRLQRCWGEWDRLDNWGNFRTLLRELEQRELLSYVQVAINNNIPGEQISGTFQKQFYYQWIDYILCNTPAVSSLNRISLDKLITTFKEKDIEQFEINKVKIRSELSAQRPDLNMSARGSQLSVLAREGEKKRKLKSIRKLFAETGDIVQRIKPCFLMSPLSVSTYLAKDAVHFDVAIFDEASQIFPQDAIGTIYRANQLIVVGDSKQMPPSNFFNASLEIEDDDEETGDVTDFESILDLCKGASMQQLQLRWHYRSRHEELIAFSNKNFYDNRLITFPSSKANASGIGVDYYHVDGIFDRKSHTNRMEAEFIVDMIYKNIDTYPERSLGVVAFSVAQQSLIDSLLSKRRLETPEKEFFFQKDQKEPFFIKNLETVQGDERDTIIFSIAYGRDAQGRLHHNFGPLNRTGGERRLNVAVTRAKYNIQVVSSMHYSDIDLKHTSSDGARLLREYLDFAENGTIALARTLNVNPWEQYDSEFEIEVCEFLRSHGFAVDTQVGCSGFRIDLALKIPDSSEYVLAIECDGATYHSSKNARDRDRLRQSILENMGWKFYRIWSTDWFKNKTIEQDRLLEAANHAIKNPMQEVAKTGFTPPPAETFEEVPPEQHSEFSTYEILDTIQIYRQCKRNFANTVRAILEKEAPLSEDWLLRRMLWHFNLTRVTEKAKSSFDSKLNRCNYYGIIRKNGFLYLEGKDILFRKSEPSIRDIKYIASEELAAGMLEILRQNGTMEKDGLYGFLASQCGKRLTKNVRETLDAALETIEDQLIVDGEFIRLK